MSRFSDLFQGNQHKEEVFSPDPVMESVEVSKVESKTKSSELTNPEKVSEETEIFSSESSRTRRTRKTR